MLSLKNYVLGEGGRQESMKYFNNKKNSYFFSLFLPIIDK